MKLKRGYEIRANHIPSKMSGVFIPIRDIIHIVYNSDNKVFNLNLNLKILFSRFFFLCFSSCRLCRIIFRPAGVFFLKPKIVQVKFRSYNLSHFAALHFQTLPRSFAKPPKEVQAVCECILVLRGHKEINWQAAKGMMSEANFLRSLMEMDCDNITNNQVSNVKSKG